jgi:hypothetical protein
MRCCLSVQAPAGPHQDRQDATATVINTRQHKKNDCAHCGTASQTCTCYLLSSILLLLQIRTTPAEITDYFDHFLLNKPQGVIDESHVHLWSPTLATRDGIYTFSLSRAGSNSTIQARFSFVYHKENGVWKIAEHHSSAMPEQKLPSEMEVWHATPQQHFVAYLESVMPFVASVQQTRGIMLGSCAPFNDVTRHTACL